MLRSETTRASALPIIILVFPGAVFREHLDRVTPLLELSFTYLVFCIILCARKTMILLSCAPILFMVDAVFRASIFVARHQSSLVFHPSALLNFFADS